MERSRPAERDHYQVLGVRPTASSADIRAAYRQLAYLLHPDRQAGATVAERRLAERRMREVNVAWTTLSVPSRRAAYDLTLDGGSGVSGSEGSGSGGTGAGGGRPSRSGSSGTAGRTGTGEWWDSDDPDAELARVRATQLAAESEDQLDVGTLDRGGFWLLRRAPIIAMLLVAVILFVLTAYAGRGASGPTATTPAPPIDPTSDCIRMMTDQMAYRVTCTSNYDARIVREEPNVLACTAADLSYAVVGSESYCVEDR